MPAAVPIAIGASAVVGAGATMIAGSKAAKAQKSAAKTAAANERYFYDTTRADQAPYREVGTGALYKLADMYGVPRALPAPADDNAPQTTISGLDAYGVGGNIFGRATDMSQGADGVYSAAHPQQQTTPGYDGFQASPGYEFRLGEGLKAIERSAAARGLLQSGGTLKALQRYGEGLASSEYENYANRLASLAGIGQTATNATQQAGAQAAHGISQATMAAGNARASSYANTGSAINSGINNALSGYLYTQGGGSGGVSVPGYGLPGGAPLPMPTGIQMPSWYGGGR